MELKKYKIDAAVSRMLKDLQKEIPMDSDDLSISTSKLFYEFKEKLLS